MSAASVHDGMVVLAAGESASSGSDWWGIFWLVVLLLGNAYFVAAEFAVISARRSQIEPRAEAGSKARRPSPPWSTPRACSPRRSSASRCARS